MSLYCYGDNSTIKEIAVRRSAGRGVRSFLYLNENAKPEDTIAIKKTLIEEGWHCVPTQVKDCNCLEVRGARKIDEMEEALRKKGFLASTRVAEVKDDKKIPIKDKFKSNLLLVYGIMNVVADTGMIGYGYLKRKLHGPDTWEDIAAGLAYSAGSVTFAAFGRGDKSDHHMRDIATQLREQLDAKGIKVANGTALDSFTNTRNLDASERFKRMMHKHSAEFGNGFTALAGGFIAFGARKGNVSTRTIDTLLGLSTLTAGSTAALVKEKAPDPDAPKPQGVIGKTKEWIQERPNRVAGIGYGISTVAHGAEVVKHMAQRHKTFGTAIMPDGIFKGTPKVKVAEWAYGMRGAFVGLNTIAEFILASASKGSGEGVKSDKGVDETAYALVADVIARQPVQMHEQLFTELSRNFLARPEVLGGEPKEIEAALRERVKKLENNPWADSPAVPAPQATVETEQNSMRWRDKLSIAPLAPAVSQAI